MKDKETQAVKEIEFTKGWTAGFVRGQEELRRELRKLLGLGEPNAGGSSCQDDPSGIS